MLDTLSGTPAEFDNQTSWWRTLIKWNRRRSASPAPEPRPIAEAAAHQCLQRGQSAAAQLLSTGTPAAPGHVHQRLPATPSSRLGPMQPGHCGRNTSLFRSPENNCITDTHNMMRNHMSEDQFNQLPLKHSQVRGQRSELATLVWYMNAHHLTQSSSFSV